MLIPMLGEACFALQEGLGTPEDIDTGAKLGLNHPMGPLELADLIGLDTILPSRGAAPRDGGRRVPPPDAPARTSSRRAGSARSGRGFYAYDDKGNRTGSERVDMATYETILLRARRGRRDRHAQPARTSSTR